MLTFIFTKNILAGTKRKDIHRRCVNGEVFLASLLTLLLDEVGHPWQEDSELDVGKLSTLDPA